MELLKGFSDPVADAQRTFRLVLKAMSEPGQIVTFTDCPDWQPLSPAICAALLTLADRDTPLYLTPLLCNEQICHNLRFHTGVTLTEQPAEAELAVLDEAFPARLLEAFACGNSESPHNSTTLLIDLPTFTDAPPLRISGPGIEFPRTVNLPLPEAVRGYLLQRPTPFPLGLDFIFTRGRQLLAIPRTTHVEVD
ncbi:phosphonate C-P lyase system protein PhnH [Erwinia psidii]|uniref:Phosphonate C-P lyase system protein PhnH n=1 Tax=Erwinia psidii TaxID=69224 RepID=A0A3N6S3R1_9GAMM|nr:phosphonate C-P lyase system protein PhnH [Erwinia psidii]MCX8957676.1 phosphonate C-P lyase system protein PhnH [Erwinia psidii]MCX8960731.1 phosphonate C-P lyase system protein PhnH [Erwinia psidii]MCX8964023.1 phosphonate C-P lyase system protein PhnH [Erwinia psidii]RQM39507.1 phosphonate C-P lyase system protein PhnH [Erwinia psidii]